MDNNIVVYNTRKFKKKKIGSGFNGTCYLTKDNKVYKEFHESEEIDRIDMDNALSKYNLDSFAMPETLVFNKKDKYIGYLRKYIEGVTLSKLEKTTNINDFILALEDFERDLITLSKEDILLYDLGSNNIIYNTLNGLVAIDSDFYVYQDPDEYDLLSINMQELSEAIVDLFVGYGGFYNSCIEQLREACTYFGDRKPSELLNLILDEMIENGMTKLNDLNDYDKGMSLIRSK